MDILAEAQRRAFSLWLRTGRLPGWLKAARAEFKFNPWHDPEDGRFTFKGTGRYFGRGGGGSGRDNAAHAHPRRPRSASAGGGAAGQGRGGGGGSGWGDDEEPFGGFGGGRSGGAGASASWDAPTAGTGSPDRDVEARARRERLSANLGGKPKADWRRVESNQYDFWIDSNGDARRIAGTITRNAAQLRSRGAQKRAGGSDRRPSDHGGHYIARRFNGPTDAFNHFAQNGNFNRSRYLALENQWARADDAGKTVDFLIVPLFKGGSRRPSRIDVWFWIDGERESVRFPNEPEEKTGAK